MVVDVIGGGSLTLQDEMFATLTETRWLIASERSLWNGSWSTMEREEEEVLALFTCEGNCSSTRKNMASSSFRPQRLLRQVAA